jgi:hypothetical protein
MAKLLPPFTREKSLACYRGLRLTMTSLMLLFAVSRGSIRAQTSASLSIAGPAEVRLGGQGSYSALVNGASANVVWSVNGIPGAEAADGMISASGVYSPGSQIFAGHSVTVSATTLSTPVSSASLTVKILNQLPTLTGGSVTRTGVGASALLDVQGSNFVSTSQLSLAGTPLATTFISSTELQSTTSLSAGTTSVAVGVLNPNAEQKSPVLRTLAVQPAATSPIMMVSPAGVAFGSATVNTPVTQPVTISSVGTAPVTVNSATLNGAGFTMSGAAFPVVLAPGLAVALDVQFSPAVAGPSSGQLTIQSNSSTNAVAVVSLTGTGLPHQAALSWELPAMATVTITGYNVYRSTGADPTPQLLNSSLVTETTYVDSTIQPGVAYEYVITSVDSSGVESPPSNQVTASIP